MSSNPSHTISSSWSRYLQNIDIRILAICVNCLFSYIVIASDALLNEDAYVYLYTAELFLNDGLASALEYYGWAGYPILIALFDKALPISMLSSAYLLNVGLYSLLIYSFITVVSEHHKSKQLQIFAALAILFFPHLNELRDQLIRDFGFWAFSMLALLQLIRFNRYHNIKNAFGWCLAIFAAVIFRIEAILLLVLCPLALLLPGTASLSKRLKSYFLLHFFLLSLTVIAWFIFTLNDVNLIELLQFSYRYYIPKLVDLFSHISRIAEQLNTAIFHSDFFPGHSNHSYLLLALSYLYIVVAALAGAFGLPYSVIFLYGLLYKKYRSPPGFLGPVFMFVGVSFFTLLTFIFAMQFVTHRYALLISLLLLAFIPICLNSIFNSAVANGKVKRFYVAFCSIAILLVVDSLISFGHSKRYIEDAAEWTQENLNESHVLYTNKRAIAYFSHRIEHFANIEQDPQFYIERISAGEYLAIEVRYRNTNLLNSLEQNPRLNLIVNFANKRNDQVRIYRATP